MFQVARDLTWGGGWGSLFETPKLGNSYWSGMKNGPEVFT